MTPGSLSEPISGAGFGVAGAVVEGRLHANNLPWDLSLQGMARTLELNAETIVLLNDVVATAWSLDKLPPEDLAILNQGVVAAERDSCAYGCRHRAGRGVSVLGWAEVSRASFGGWHRGLFATNRPRDPAPYLFEKAHAACLLRGHSFRAGNSLHPRISESCLASSFVRRFWRRSRA